jgi:ribulose 1,5-bisphosphate carboxylase large subunit-like protein
LAPNKEIGSDENIPTPSKEIGSDENIPTLIKEIGSDENIPTLNKEIGSDENIPNQIKVITKLPNSEQSYKGKVPVVISNDFLLSFSLLVLKVIFFRFIVFLV